MNNPEWPLPRIFYGQHGAPPGIWIDEYPENVEVYRFSASMLHRMITRCYYKGGDLMGGILYIPLALELAAWDALTAFNTSVLRSHISTICIDERLRGDRPHVYAWAVRLGEVIGKSSGDIYVSNGEVGR